MSPRDREKGTVPICRNGPEGASHKWGLSPFPGAAMRRGVQIGFLLAFLALVLLAGQRPYWDPRLAAVSLARLLTAHAAILGVLAVLVLLGWALTRRSPLRWPVLVVVLSLAQIAWLPCVYHPLPDWKSEGFSKEFSVVLAVQIVALMIFIGFLASAWPGRHQRPQWWLRWPFGLFQTALVLLFFRLVVLLRTSPGWDPVPWLGSFFAADPLILVMTWLAAHAVPLVLLWSLVVIAATVLFGRVFCGWVCPLGTVHAAASHVLLPRKPGRTERDHWSPWQRTKYYVLIGLLVMALVGVHWGTVFDPLVWLYRTTAAAILPAAWWSVEDPWVAVNGPEPVAGLSWLNPAIDPAYRVFRDNVFLEPHPGAFLGAGLILALFAGMVLLNAYRRRFWCRYLCPLGALLGIFSLRPLLRRATQQANCNQCDLCGTACHGAAAGGPGQQWRPSECLGCLNCTDSCPRESLGFQWTPPWRKEPAVVGIGLSRRAMVGAALGGLVALPLLRISPQSRGRTFNPDLVRPPGARLEREFLARCTGCGLCIKVCPTGGLQPTLAEAGLEGIWTPRLVPQLGFCDYECNLCGQVCPTEAIVPLSLEEKKQVRIGVAVIDVTRCIPYAYGRNCITCEEQCPVLPKKAIFALDVDIQDETGQKKQVKQPHVAPALCIGCGKCENVCPYKDRPAIRVSSANESRHPANQPFQRAEESPYG